MRMAVSLATALVLIVFGVLWMFVMLIGLNVWAQPIDGGPPRQLTDFKTDQTFSLAGL